MPSISFNITGSNITLSTNVSAGSQLTMSIQNPTEGASYFVLETVRNQDGFYDSSSPKNTSGSFELKSGIIGLVSDDYKMGAVVQKGSSELVFTPAINVVGNTLRVRGVGNEFGGGAVETYAELIAKAYEARVIDDGGIVEALGCFTAFATALGAYQPPIALAATGIGETSFTANWEPFDGAKYYLLDVSTAPTFDTFVYEDEIIMAPTTSYVVIGLNSNTTYYYRVRASTLIFPQSTWEDTYEQWQTINTTWN
jgi:hypothetical protein